MHIISFGGKSIKVTGNNICVQNGRVFVDGKEYIDGVTSGILEIKVEGGKNS